MTTPASSSVLPSTSDTPRAKGIADVVFLVDATGSMAPNISSLKRNLESFFDTLVTPSGHNGVLPVKDWRASVWGYRDVKADGSDWLVRNPFVRDVNDLKRQLSSLNANGGGDEPESLLDALHLLGTLPASERDEDPAEWRALYAATRVVVVLTDASFHGEMDLPEAAGGTVDNIIDTLEDAHIHLSVFAPAMGCYDDLAQLDGADYQAIPVEAGEGPVAALARFTGDTTRFQKTLEMLAKSVSRFVPPKAVPA